MECNAPPFRAYYTEALGSAGIALAATPAKARTLIVAVLREYGLKVSTDAGRTWRKASYQDVLLRRARPFDVLAAQVPKPRAYDFDHAIYLLQVEEAVQNQLLENQYFTALAQA
jgi:hypothetical protein